MKQLIYPSIMAKNQRELDLELKRLSGTIKELHLDIVDGKFAPNHSLDFKFKLPKNFTYNVHLMIKHPEPWIEKYEKKIELAIPQIEEVENIYKYITWRKKKGKKVAFALLPKTKVSRIKIYLKEIDYILILTVHPGFYGSKFMPEQLRKIKDLKKINPKIKIIVDGGINPITIIKAAKAGADYFVSGSFVTKSDNPKIAINKLVNCISK